MSISEAQDLRKKGFYLVTNKNNTKVIIVTRSYDEALSKSENNKLYYPLSKMEWTKDDTKKALQELALGMQCNYSINKL